MKTPTIDTEAIQQAILRELARQGVEFAQVDLGQNYPLSEKHFIVQVFSADQLNPKYLDLRRVCNQIKADPAVPVVPRTPTGKKRKAAKTHE